MLFSLIVSACPLPEFDSITLLPSGYATKHGSLELHKRSHVEKYAYWYHRSDLRSFKTDSEWTRYCQSTKIIFSFEKRPHVQSNLPYLNSSGIRRSYRSHSYPTTILIMYVTSLRQLLTLKGIPHTLLQPNPSSSQKLSRPLIINIRQISQRILKILPPLLFGVHLAEDL